jgi:hypothetical protein
MQERKKERRDQKTKKSEKKAETFFCTKKRDKTRITQVHFPPHSDNRERKRIEKQQHHDDSDDDADDSYPAIPEREFRHLVFLLEEEHETTTFVVSPLREWRCRCFEEKRV